MLDWILGLFTAIINFLMGLFLAKKQVTFADDTKSDDEVQLPQPTQTLEVVEAQAE